MDGTGPTAATHGVTDPTSPPDEVYLDPATSERRIYREPTTGLHREIWRPGDGEGDQGTEYYDRVGPPLPREARWRLFQSDIGAVTAKNQPPRFVMLDDQAVYEVVNSDLPCAKLSQNWPHDFAGSGKVRARRLHRGRPSIKATTTDGTVEYHSISTASGKEDYILSGVKDYQPVLYRREPHEPKPKKIAKRKRMLSPTSPDYNPLQHGHNQYTPKDMMVKHGATPFSLKEKKPIMRRPKSWLPADSPSHVSGRVSASMSPVDGLEEDQSDGDGELIVKQLGEANLIIERQAIEINQLKETLTMGQAGAAVNFRTAAAVKTETQPVMNESSLPEQAAEIASLEDELAISKARVIELEVEIQALRQQH